jgi:hypothetical protein
MCLKLKTFNFRKLLTPTVSMAPALFCKMVACIDPYVYAISHPRYRAELQRRWLWLHVKKRPPVQVHSENASIGSQASNAISHGSNASRANDDSL